MKTRDGAVISMFDNCDDCIDTHAGVLGGITTCGARVKLTAARRTCDAHVTAQDVGILEAKSATDTKRTLRARLERDLMPPISRIAASEQPSVPELRPFKSVRGALNERRLIAAAEGMAKAVVPYKATFVAAGLADDFIEQLEQATEALRASIGTPRSRRRSAIGATKGLKEAIATGRHAVRVLDSLIRVALKNDPVRLAEWNSAKRIGRRKRVSGVVTTTSPATSAATTTMSAAA